jgi:cold shock protein
MLGRRSTSNPTAPNNVRPASPYNTRYSRQFDGPWRFAAPFSFSCFSSEKENGFRSSPTKETIMPIGTVKFFDNAKGYGFITNEAGGNDAFVHMTAVEAAGMRTLEKEQRLSYELENDQRGKTSAVNLQSA